MSGFDEKQVRRDSKNGTLQNRIWVDAMVAEGFTRDEALRIMCTPRITIDQALSPEMNEFLTKLNILTDRGLAEE